MLQCRVGIDDYAEGESGVPTSYSADCFTVCAYFLNFHDNMNSSCVQICILLFHKTSVFQINESIHLTNLRPGNKTSGLRYLIETSVKKTET